VRALPESLVAWLSRSPESRRRRLEAFPRVGPNGVVVCLDEFAARKPFLLSARIAANLLEFPPEGFEQVLGAGAVLSAPRTANAPHQLWHRIKALPLEGCREMLDSTARVGHETAR
jgi:hypothetical protein